jgi:outer membrane protein
MRFRRLAALSMAAALFAAGGAAHAQDGYAAPQYVLDLGAGGVVKPQYPGADKYMLLPYPIIEVGRFYLPGIGQTQAKTHGFFVYPSFNINGERKPSDDGSLAGTKNIDWAFEAGLGAGYRYDWLRVFATVRQGFNGYDGQVGEFGADVILPMGSRFEVAFGPRGSWGSTDYMRTYFGVTPAEAARGSLAAYKPDGGIKSAGLAAKVTYALSERTHLQVRGSWDRLIGEAGDSPIVKAGNANQWMVGIGLSHRFSFNLFR